MENTMIARNDFAYLGRSTSDDADAAYDEKRADQDESKLHQPTKMSAEQQARLDRLDEDDAAFGMGLLNGTINFHTGLPVY